MHDLKKIGWDSFFENAFRPFQGKGFDAGRVAVEHRDYYLVFTKRGEYNAETAGKLHYTSESRADLPKVGDWVVLSFYDDSETAIIHNVLPRKTKFSRKVTGEVTREQIIASNIDTIFVVQALDDTYNIRRLERYLVMAYEGDSMPAVILNKADLCEDLETCVAEVESVAQGIPVLCTSATTGDGLESLCDYAKEGKTLAFIGSSGVGKTTLINNLLGKDVLKTAAVRDKDSKGRHTTARREMLILPKGGVVIDTPGMRELQLWQTEDDATIMDSYADFTELSAACFFSDCSHLHEKGCAIIEAVSEGNISQERYDGFVKLQKELLQLQEKKIKQLYLEKKKKEKQMGKMMKQLKQYRKSNRRGKQ
jgi:ribosome biogenesis GTPase